MSTPRVLTLASVLVSSGLAYAEEIDKSQYGLFHPTPENQMRELSTDRPDKTESPYTVDAGHFQIETDLFNQSREKVKSEDTEITSTSYLASNLKVGLSNSIDLQLVIVPVAEEKVKTQGVSHTETGLGDTTLRLKMNFLGNDGGPLAIGLMPFVKIPTAKDELGNDKYEGGVILPIGLELPNEWSLGVMFQVNYLKNAANDGFHNEFVSSITSSHAIVGELSGYMEFYSEISADTGAEWVATYDAGITYGVSSNVQLDAGVNFGITEAADDINPFVGFSARI